MAGGTSVLYLSADTSAAAESEGVVLSGISLTEEGITAQNVCVLNSVDFGCSKTTLKTGMSYFCLAFTTAVS